VDETEQLHDFLRELNQEIRQRAASDGLLFEEAATRHLADLLADVDLTSDVVYYTEDRQSGSVVYRIDAFALSEGDENLDLFVVQAGGGSDEITTLNTTDVGRLSRLAEQFLTRGLKGYLKTEIGRHSPVYELAAKLANNDSQPVRVRIFILTTALLGSRVQGIEERRTKHGNVLMQFHVWDLDRFYRTSTSGYAREPIEINFVRDFDAALPCLPMPVSNDDYQSYLAIVPGELLADIYEKYGARLLEQNVRSFLQFGNKTNKGIRETILKVPHRFLAYNNGLAATASEVEMVPLPQGGYGIGSIKALQIVNGGQTTASIFQTRREVNTKDKGANPLDQVFVQMKLTVMRHPEEMAVMVPLISRFANTQNGISPADFSSNSEFNTELERVSRTTTAPAQAGSQVLTRWFFERARGQYKVELARRLTKSSRTAFEKENPKSQVLTKETTAKFYLAWGGKPHIVANGAQNLYTFFTNPHDEAKPRPKPLPKLPLPDKFWFQDVVAKAILFQATEKIYDQQFGRSGGFRAAVVCYSVAWVRYLMGDQQAFSLSKIWQQQKLTEPMREAMRAGLIVVNDYMRSAGAAYSTPGEWAKKAECWSQLKALPVPSELRAAIQAVPTSDRAPDVARTRQTPEELARDEQRVQAAALTSLGEAAWDAIETWGRQTQLLSLRQLEMSGSISRAIGRNRSLTESEIKNGHAAIDAVLEHQPDLLSGIEEATPSPAAEGTRDDQALTLELLQHLYDWERSNKCLTDFHFNMIRKLVREQRLPKPFEEKLIQEIVLRARAKGYQPPSAREVAI
jgi:hypothetical protein